MTTYKELVEAVRKRTDATFEQMAKDMLPAQRAFVDGIPRRTAVTPGRGGATTGGIMIGVDLAFEQSTAVMGAPCEHCSAIFTGATASEVNFHLREHHAVCEKRPIAVGDYVRWEYPKYGKWAEGEVVEMTSALEGNGFQLVKIRLSACAGGPWRVEPDPQPVPGGVHEFGISNGGGTLRRIPRTVGAEQATLTCAGCGRVDAVTADVCVKCRASNWRRTTSVADLVTTASGDLAVRTAHGDIQITSDPTLKPGDFRFEQRDFVPVVVTKEQMNRAARDATLMGKLQEQNEARVKYLSSGLPVASERDPDAFIAPSAPALVDGLEEFECLRV